MKGSLLLTVILGTLMMFGPISIDMYLPSMPTIAREFGVAESRVQLTLSALVFGLAAGQLIYGPLSDRYGRRAPLTVGVVLYGAASLGCAVATSVESMVVLRLLQGVGAAAGGVLARAIVRDIYDRDDGARILSVLYMVMSAAPMIAPHIGSQIMWAFDWRAIFWVLLGFGLLALALSSAGLRETHPLEKRVRHAPIEMLAAYTTLLKDRRFVGYALIGGFTFAGMFTFFSAGPFTFEDAYGISPQGFAALFSINVVGIILTSFLNTRLVKRLSVDRMLIYSTLWTTLTGALMALTAQAELENFLYVFVPLMLFVAPVAMTIANTNAGALEDYPQLAGTGAALLGAMMYTVGATIGVVVGQLYDGTPMPMALFVFASGTAALLARLFLVGPGRTAKQA